MEFRRAIQRAREWATAAVMPIFYMRPRPALEKRRTPAIAAGLYARMNRALAAGDLRDMEGCAAPGLLANLRARAAGMRQKGDTGLEWTLVKHVAEPKLVSFQFNMMQAAPGETKSERSGIVQAVVRLHTLQALLRTRAVKEKNWMEEVETVVRVVDERGRPVSRGEVEAERKRRAKETVEYFVIQKILRKGKMGSWMAWGTTEEMTLERMRADEKMRLRQTEPTSQTQRQAV